jgi:hypothetical protein
MFSVIGLRKVAEVSIVQTEEEFWKRFEHYRRHFDSSTNELERAHGEVDLRLVEAIEKVIQPILGPSGFNGEPWHQNLDFYGDGVRSLEVDSSRFVSAVITPLHATLGGEHERFSILIEYYRNFTDEPLQKVGVLALFAPRILMMQSLVAVLEHA